MDLAIFAKTFSASSVERLFTKIRAHQLHYVHYNMACSGLAALPLEVAIQTLNEITAAATATQIRLIGLSATFNMIHPDPQEVEEGLQALDTLATTAQAIGTTFLSLCTGSRDPHNKWNWHPDNARLSAWKDLRKTMETAIQIAEKHEVFLGIEPETGNVVRTPALARQLLDEMQSDRLRIILDPANLFEEAQSSAQINYQIQEALELLQEEIAVAHAKDRSLRGEVRAVGHGAVDFRFFVAKLREMHFEGPLVLHGLGEEEVPAALAHLREC